MPSERDIQIFLAENRSQTEFKDGILFKEIFSLNNLKIEMNDVFLNPNSEFKISQNNQCFISYIGDLKTDNQSIIEENSFLIDSNLQIIQNPYENESINFIQFKIDGLEFQENQKLNLNLEEIEINTISKIDCFNHLLVKIQIGKFEGRFETLINQSGSFLIIIIEGVFEIEGCLLEKNDVLIIKNQSNFEVESLSNEALLLIFSDAT